MDKDLSDKAKHKERASGAIFLDHQKVSFRRDETSGAVTLTVDDEKSYRRVYALRVFPQSEPQRFIQLFEGRLDGARGELIGIIRELSDLSKENQKWVEHCLRSSYLIPEITRVLEVREKRSWSHWSVETELGACQFVVTEPVQNVRLYASTNRVQIKDVQGNRYDIADYSSLEAQSRKILERFV